MRTRLYAYGAGILLLLVGTVGFVVTGFSGFVEARSGDLLLGLRLNPTLNFVHLILGATWLWAGASGQPVARATTGLVGALLAALGVAGLWLAGRPDYNILALNTADSLLHLTLGGLGVLAGLAGAGVAGQPPPQQAGHSEQ